MKNFILGLIIGFILIPLGLYVYFVSGMAPVATAAQAMPFERMLAHKALDARVDKEAPKNSAMVPDESLYTGGAQIYIHNCAVCHGLPNQNPPTIARGEFPRPPQLWRGHGVTDDPPGETYWKVANGIRMTGMPSFRNELSDTQMWQVSLLLANADKVPESVKQALASPGAAPPPAPNASK